MKLAGFLQAFKNWLVFVLSAERVTRLELNALEEVRASIRSPLRSIPGLVGYAVYSPTKFAVRGLAETLAMELCPFGIGVSVCNPAGFDPHCGFIVGQGGLRAGTSRKSQFFKKTIESFSDPPPQG